MAISESQKLSIAKYRQEKRDRISTDVPKGKREVYNVAAKGLGLSLSMLIQNGVEEYISRHAGKNPLAKPQTKSLSPAEEKLLAEFSKLPPDAKKHLVELAKIINQKGDVQND